MAGKGAIAERETSPSAVERLMAHVRSEFHDPSTGRLDVQKVARALAIPVSHLVKAVGVSSAALQKNPASLSIQESLGKIAFSYVMLERTLGSREQAVKWLNAPHPDFGGKSPLFLIEEGKVDAVVGLLNDVLAGQIS